MKKSTECFKTAFGTFSYTVNKKIKIKKPIKYFGLAGFTFLFMFTALFAIFGGLKFALTMFFVILLSAVGVGGTIFFIIKGITCIE